ncbi:tetratricopeptide repeat protein [Litchfieldia salsa]|uniref:Tetratricopeptide repeat-containing protein n=1 Tax=Litchfieldia salsa TaxID=930152 RepID=A0A1H0WBT4_9BACI|nr:tetratricopeptide repeat protein [Litchfieldia salsa]SDP88162.1 Tetratricopeptide repeat-containing protein [Litchfieldia salsa]
MGENTMNDRQHQIAKIIPFLQTGEYYFKKGLKAYRKRDIYKAKKHLQRAIQIQPEDSMFLCQLAVVLTELGEYTQSNRILLSVIEKVDSEMTECFYFMANNYAHLGLFQEAYKYANLYLEMEPDGEFIEDTEDLLELLSIESDVEEEEFELQDELIVKQEKAREYLENGELEQAIQLLKEIISLYPDFWSAYNNLALAYFYSGEVAKAAEMLEEVLDKNPGNLHALCNMLVFLYYQRKNKKVKELVGRLESIHPILVEHRYKLGATFGLVGRYDLAYKWLRHLHKQGFQGDETFYYWLSHSAYFTNRLDVAKSAWERVLEENPDKKGSEPWADGKTKNFNDILDRWLKGDYIEERLYGLYLLSKTNKSITKDDIDGLELHATLELEFAEYICQLNRSRKKKQSPDYIEQGYQVVELLFNQNKNNGSSTEGLYLTWFMIYDQAILRNYHVSNCSAWAAATEYMWRKHQLSHVSQKEMASKYNISQATITKYVKYVKELLQ